MKLHIKYMLITLVISNPGGLCAQLQRQARLDSLLQALPKAMEDTNKVDVLYSLSEIYKAIKPDSGLVYAQSALNLSTKLDWKKGTAMALNTLGNNYSEKSDYPKALECYLRALKLCEELGMAGGIASATGNIGLIYKEQGDYPKALEYFLKCQKLFEATGNVARIASVYYALGTLYCDGIKDRPKALEYFFKALKLQEEIGNKPGIANVMGGITTVYINQGDLTKALEYQEKALKLNEALGRKSHIAHLTSGMALIYQRQHDYLKTVAYLLKALKMNEEMGDKNGITTQSVHLGATYLNILTDSTENGRKWLNEGRVTDTAAIPVGKAAILRKAFAYIERGLATGKEIGALERMKESYEDLTLAYRLAGEYDKALVAFQDGIKIKDSVFNKENEKKMGKLEAKVEYEHKEDSLKLENERKELTLKKEMELNALKYEYEKKHAAAKTEREKQQLVYEEELKRNKINFEYEQKTLAAEEGQKRIALVEKVKQQRKDDEAMQKLKRQQTYTYAGVGGALLLLCFSFFIVRERGKSEKLLLNILPSEVAKELKQKGYADAQHFNEVTVLFTDFVSFTTVSERLSPQELVNELNVCFKAFDHIMGTHKIEKIKTVGDAYLAVCGLPKATPDHAVNIINAAKEIGAFMIKRKEELGNKTFGIRLGVNSGSVVAGIVGVKKFAYDIWGDTVNTAARMEQNSEDGKINISQSTYDLVKDKFDCVYRGEIDAKNKGILKMYFVS